MVSEKILLITGDGPRHRYFINHLNFNFNLAGIIIEPSDYPAPPSKTPEEESAWDWYFSRRRTHELKAFSESESLPPKNNPAVIQIPPSSINSPDTINRIKGLTPDLIAMFGTSILGLELINLYPQRIFNLHAGLAGSYRGSSCNFWPIHDRRLDLLGASIIRINAGIDSGDILAQQTIQIEENDDEQSLSAKTVILGSKLMIETIKNCASNSLSPIYQSEKGKLFLKKSFSPKSILSVKKMVERGEIEEMARVLSIQKAAEEKEAEGEGS